MNKGFYIFLILLLFLFLSLLSLLPGTVYTISGLLIIILSKLIIDLSQSENALVRNYPIIGHLYYFFESLHPKLGQYFFEHKTSDRPFSQKIQSLVYKRSQGKSAIISFGIQKDIIANGHEWVQHSLKPVSVEAIEPYIEIGGPQCKHPYKSSYLNISAMSLGTISNNAILALSSGARIGGFALNTGEGGISPYHLEGGGDLIWQIGTGYFGCRSKDGRFEPQEFKEKAQIDTVKMIELKISQGAKPSYGGILPASKITNEISSICNIPLGRDSILQPTHETFTNPKELLDFIASLRELSGGKPIGIKLCLGRRSEFLGICKAILETGILPDFITIDGAEGGAGAAPIEFVEHVGSPLTEAIVFIHNALVGINVRDHIRIIVSGKIATGFDIISRIAIGADLCASARAFMLSLGCVQALQCEKNTCPTGIATQNKRLTWGLVVDEKKLRVANFHTLTIRSFLEILGSMGISNPQELSPSYVFCQSKDGIAKKYSDLYHYLKPGDLLEAVLPKDFSHDWQLADARSF